jgi:hypothetical protein
MKTHTDITVRLLDGKSQLASWSRDFEKIPTIGETLRVEAGNLRGYKPEAAVSRIDMDLSGENPVVVLDAEPLDGNPLRTVVFLNKNYVPKSLRHDVETHLRSKLDVPAFEWVAGNEGRPVIDIHTGSREVRARFDRLNEEVRAILADASSLATL